MENPKLKKYIVGLLGDIPKTDLISDNILGMLSKIPQKEQVIFIMTAVDIAIQVEDAKKKLGDSND